MKKSITAGLIAALLTITPLLAAPPAKSYQVTGPIVELTESTIVVQKGDEKWEIARTAETKAPANLKVGAKVTVHYTMHAKSIEAKPK